MTAWYSFYWTPAASTPSSCSFSATSWFFYAPPLLHILISPCIASFFLSLPLYFMSQSTDQLQFISLPYFLKWPNRGHLWYTLVRARFSNQIGYVSAGCVVHLDLWLCNIRFGPPTKIPGLNFNSFHWNGDTVNGSSSAGEKRSKTWEKKVKKKNSGKCQDMIYILAETSSLKHLAVTCEVQEAFRNIKHFGKWQLRGKC